MGFLGISMGFLWFLWDFYGISMISMGFNAFNGDISWDYITDSFSVSAGTAAAVPYCPAVRT